MTFFFKSDEIKDTLQHRRKWWSHLVSITVWSAAQGILQCLNLCPWGMLEENPPTPHNNNNIAVPRVDARHSYERPVMGADSNILSPQKSRRPSALLHSLIWPGNSREHIGRTVLQYTEPFTITRHIESCHRLMRRCVTLRIYIQWVYKRRDV